jgi:hypothetical protein
VVQLPPNSVPVWDGMTGGGGRVTISRMNSEVTCLRPHILVMKMRKSTSHQLEYRVASQPPISHCTKLNDARTHYVLIY